MSQKWSLGIAFAGSPSADGDSLECMLVTTRAAAPDPHEEPSEKDAIAASASPSTLPISDTHPSGVAISKHATDFGLAIDPFESGPDPLIGVDLGGVRVERRIAEGGMGRVYEAQQVQPARTVAVKVMRTPALGAAAVQRFRREAQALARLRHPAIAQIITAGCHRCGIVDVPYYVMEFIPSAQPLVEACNRRALRLRERLEVMLTVCEAIGHGHAEGVVHRDIKPGNILVDANGRPKIIDFGIARMDGIGGPGDAPQTETGQFIGTRPYMAPEQFEEHRSAIDARTDVYAIGVVMYELLAGRLPYAVAGKSLVETALIVKEIKPDRLVIAGLCQADHGLASGAEAIAAKCLEKNPADRYPSAAEVAADLRRLLMGESIVAASATIGGGSGRERDASWHRSLAVVAAAAAVLCVACVGVVWSVRSQQESPQVLENRFEQVAKAASASSAAPPITARFATVSSGRTSPLAWVDLSFDTDVFGLSADDFVLMRNGTRVSVSGLEVTGGARIWRIGGLATLTAEAGDYVLAFVGTGESPKDASGTVVRVSAEVTWRSPPYREIRFSLMEDDWDRHVVSLEAAERFTERHAGATTFLRPTVAGREGVIMLRFDLPFTIQDATLTAPVAVWTTGDPFPYDPGARAILEASPDGERWTTLVDLKAGAGGFNSESHDIGRIVASSTRIWVRARLTAGREWPGDGLIFAQFLRTDPAEKETVFLLTATGPHPPVIPDADP